MQRYNCSHDSRDGSAVGAVKRPYFSSAESEFIAHDHMRLSTNAYKYTSSGTSSQASSPQMSHRMHQHPRRTSTTHAPLLQMSSQGFHQQPYGSQDNSTLPSPSLMTPITNDYVERGTGSRRSSNSGTPSATTLLSPQSPRDYDFPTGNYLPLQYQTFDDSWLHADSSIEGFQESRATSCLSSGALTLDTYSGCLAPLGPPYPAHILGEASESVPEYFDPRILQPTTPHSTLSTEEYLPNYGVECGQSFLPDTYGEIIMTVADEDNANQSSQYIVDPAILGSLQETQRPVPLSRETPASEPQTPHSEHQSQPSKQSTNRRRKLPTRQAERLFNQCTDCDKTFDTATKLKKHIRKDHTRPYPCIFDEYGCTSVFGTKNEWFRHIKVQHLRLETWKCDIDDCNRLTPAEDHLLLLPSASKGKYEYDRKDLFLNHVRRCHKDAYPSPDLDDSAQSNPFEDMVQQRCRVTLRATPTATLCPCCPGKTWKDFDLRCEHIGRGMERDGGARAGFHDPFLELYMIQEGLLQWRDGAGWSLTGAEGKKGGRQARRGTGRARRGEEVEAEAEAEVEVEVEAEGTRKSRRNELKRRQRRRQRDGLGEDEGRRLLGWAHGAPRQLSSTLFS